MKKRIKRSVAVITVFAAVFFVLPRIVRAEPVTNIVMTYQDKVFTKQIYSVEVNRIRQGEDTDGLKDVGGLLDNLTFQTNGEVKVDKAAVINDVRNSIIAT